MTALFLKAWSQHLTGSILALVLRAPALAQTSPGSGVRIWTEADTAASRANPPIPPPPMPPRPTGYEGLSDRDLYQRLVGRLVGFAICSWSPPRDTGPNR